MINDAFVPPKPNELDRTVLISFLRAFSGTRSMSVSTEGFSRLRVGGQMLSLSERSEKIASTAPAAPNRCPVDDLVEDIDKPLIRLPINLSTALSSISSLSGVEVPWALI